MMKKKLALLILLTLSSFFPYHVFAGEIKAKQVVEMSNGKSVFVLMDNGDLWAWGDNNNGELGAGKIQQLKEPQMIMTGVKEVSSIDSYYGGGVWSYILKLDGSLWGTGSNQNGQLLDNKRELKYTPIKIMDNCSQILGLQILKKDGKVFSIRVNRDTLAEANTAKNNDHVIQYELVESNTNVGYLVPKGSQYDATLIKNNGSFYDQNMNNDDKLILTPIKYASVQDYPYNDNINFSAYILENGQCVITINDTAYYGYKKVLCKTEQIANAKPGMIVYQNEEGKSMEMVMCLLSVSGELTIVTSDNIQYRIDDKVKQLLQYNYYITEDETLCQWGSDFNVARDFESALKIFKLGDDVQAVSTFCSVFVDGKGSVYKMIDGGSDEKPEKLFDILINNK